MFRRIAEKIWWMMPYYFRIRTVRALQPKFTASVVGIITNEKGEILILDHYFRPKFCWGLPGGFLEANEAPESGIRREIKEETDLDLHDLILLRIRSTGSHLEIIFRARGSGEAKVNSTEIRDFGWFHPDRLPEMSKTQIDFLNEFLD
ncbi:MAG: NUDIX hydrolase [Pyrinomonadaceae bacterium]